MLTTKKVRGVRLAEKLTLSALLGWSGWLAVWFGLGKIGLVELLSGAVLSLLLLVTLFFIERMVDQLLSLGLSQANYAEVEVFTSLYERSPVGYLTLNKKGQVSSFNPSAVKLFHSTADKFTGLNFYKQIEPNEDSLDVLRSKIEAGITINDQEMPMNTVDDKLIWVMVSVVPYRNIGESLVSLVDVTDQKNVDTAKSEFVALATHQLRTPIAAIRWNAELLGKSFKGSETESQARYLDKVNRNVLRMIALINDFLSVSKLEMGTYAASREDINFSEFFTSIADEFAEKITGKQLTLNRTEDPPNTMVNTDSRLIHIIVSNLMSNAVKYAKKGGTITMSYQISGKVLELVVADDGIGVPEEEIGELFTKFYRASNAQSHQTQGTGLGLYIVKQSVEQLGGTISVESGEDKGAKFTASIPV